MKRKPANWGDVDRGVEAGAASGALIGLGLATFFVVPLLAIRDWWAQLELHPLLSFALVALTVLIAFTALHLGGVPLGAGLGMVFAIGYERLPGKPTVLKGVMLSLFSWPIFVFLEILIHVIGQRPLLESVLADFWWPMLLTIYGVLFGIYWRRLDQPGGQTFLRNLHNKHPRLWSDIIIIFVVTLIALAAILSPIAGRWGYTGRVLALPDQASLVLGVVIILMLAIVYAAAGRIDWLEAKAKKLARNSAWESNPK